jgi:FkbM family methyltransferase
MPASALALTPAGLRRRLRKGLALLRRPRYRRALWHGVAAAIEHHHMAAVAARTVIDVGAHRGQFSLLALELFPEARIFAFEPLAEPRRRFETVLRDEPRVRLFPLALGAASGVHAMQIAARDDCSSFLPVTPAQIGLIPTARAVASEEVAVARLADVLTPEQLDRPSLLKIDVEASFRESYAGQGLVSELLERLGGHEFTMHGVYTTVYDGRGHAIQADFDFRRTADAASALDRHRQPE